MLAKGAKDLKEKEIANSAEPIFKALEHFSRVAKNPPLDLSKRKKKEAETALTELKTKIYSEIESARSLILLAWQDKEMLAAASQKLKTWNPAAN